MIRSNFCIQTGFFIFFSDGGINDIFTWVS